MARSRSRGATRSTSKKAAPAVADEVEIIEEEKGLSMEDGIAIVTGVLLIVAILLVDYELGSSYGKGLFF